MKSLTYFLLVLIVAVFSITGCSDNTVNDLFSNEPKFSVEKFAENLKDEVGKQAIGWAYVINMSGNLAKAEAFGYARAPVDGDVKFKLSKKINVASITKFLTAIAVMQLLDRRNLSIDAKIGPWLPQAWDNDNGVNLLTFKDLLRHRSGLNSKNSDFENTLCFDCLKDVINQGVVKPKEYEYLNANFALFRIIIPNLWRGLPGAPFIPELNADKSEEMYLRYMQEEVFSKIGLGDIDCRGESRTTATLYYNKNDLANNRKGQAYSDWSHISGGGGYYMTPVEIAAVLAYYEHTDVLVTEESRELMKQWNLGFDGGYSDLEEHGDYHQKNGSISNSDNDNTKQGVLGNIVIFPNNVEVTVIMNSQGAVFSDNNFFTAMIYKAFNEAWE